MYKLRGILSQCVHTSHHHIVHFKHLTILFVSYTSVTVGGDGEQSNFAFNVCPAL